MREDKKREIYHCRRLRRGETGFCEGCTLYTPPVQKRMALRAVSAETMLLTGGELSVKRLVAKLPTAANTFCEGDKCYVFAPLPKEADAMCKTADFKVISVQSAHTFTEIILESVVKKNADI